MSNKTQTILCVILFFTSATMMAMDIYENFMSDDDLDAFSFRLLEEDFDTDLTLNGFTVDDPPPLVNRDVPLIVTDDSNVTGRKIFLQTQTFACQTYANLYLTIALVGPVQKYLPAYDGETVLPFTLHSDQGIFIIENDPNVPSRIRYDNNIFKSLVLSISKARSGNRESGGEGNSLDRVNNLLGVSGCMCAPVRVRAYTRTRDAYTRAMLQSLQSARPRRHQIWAPLVPVRPGINGRGICQIGRR